jgi:MFS family permease
MKPHVERITTAGNGLRWLFVSTAAAVTGQGAVAAAAPLLAASLTRDPFQVALVAAAAWAPWLAVGVFTGALIDRWNARLVMISTDAFRAIIMLALGINISLGNVSVFSLGLAVLLCGIGSCLFDPASQSEIPALTDRSRAALARANGTFWTIDTLARTLLGATAGALLFAQDRALPFVAQGALFVVSAAALFGIPKHKKYPLEKSGKFCDDVSSGFSFLWSSHILRNNASCMAFYNMFYNISFATAILVLQRNLNLESSQFGLLLACAALGGVFGGWVARYLLWSIENAYGVGFFVQGIGWLTVLFAPNLWVAALGFCLMGVVSTFVSAIGGAASQLATPAGMVGRVTSTTRVIGIGAAAVGSVLSGFIATVGGLSAPILVSAAMLSVGTVAICVRRLFAPAALDS